MNYQRLALIYDRLMAEAPYEEWVSFANEMIERYHPDVQSIVDLGCGTGEITKKLYESGYQITGVDLSEDMLAVAQQKSPSAIQWLCQDVTRLDGLKEYDCVISFCDVINYLTDELEVKNAFKHAYNALKNEGLFLFDVHSISHIQNDLYGHTFAEVYDDLSYIWFCDPGESENSVIHDLTFFVEETGKYVRFDERHRQKGYPLATLKQWLEKTGFIIRQISADFNTYSSERGDRLFFTCQKINE